MSDFLARKAIARRAGLPETATWEEIQEAGALNENERRVTSLIAALLKDDDA